MQKMSEYNLKLKKLLFAVILVLCISPIVIIPAICNNYHNIYKQPVISNGVLDLKNYSFSNGMGIPLVGSWKFYWNKWIVTDQNKNASPDSMIKVPSYWNKYKINNNYLPTKGYASYELKVKNWPGDRSLICYIPNIGVAYRVFFNGNLEATRGVLNKAPNAIEVGQHVVKKYPSASMGNNVDIVIEVDSFRDPGIYLAPVLMDTDADISQSNTLSILAGIYLGIVLVMLTGYGIVFASSGRNLYSVYLLLFAILMSFNISMRDEFYGISSIFHFNIAQIGFITYIVTSLSPLVFLMCLKDILHLKLSKREIGGLALYCTSSFFVIMTVNTYQKGWVLPVFVLLTSISIVLILRKLAFAIRNNTQYAMPITIAYVLLFCGIIVDTFYVNGTYILNMSMYLPLAFCVFLMIMVMIYAKQNAEMQNQAIEAENLRLKIKEAETDLMLSQIKPHFIFNALTAILALIRTNPRQAESMVKSFSKYLRANMTSIESKDPIPFENELKHIKTYVELEQVRFQKRLNVIYDINIQNFKVPPLTIQPLVENAIRHGICKRKDGGTIVIRTYLENNYVCIEIQDDGIGFDTDILIGGYGNSLGIKNVKFRLSQINAIFNINSEQDKGTLVRVQIPIERGGIFL
ncbi:MAG TPA: histidine kinase [Ruminiclostridium sp.]|nr:histidine kinase [Ruminiclostridium sp.]